VPAGFPTVRAGILLVGTGLTRGVLQSWFIREFAGGERGTGFGLVRTTFVLAGPVGNAATSVLADISGRPPAIGVLIALLCVAAAPVVGNRLLGLGL
jgi:uncharacterized protein YaaW (UPF0174 family)